MLPVNHGIFPQDELVPVTTLWTSKKGTGTLWGRLTETMRIFLFPGQAGIKKARLAIMEKTDIAWYTLCSLEDRPYGWCGGFGLSYVKIKLNNKEKPTDSDSYGLYFSPYYKEKVA